MTEKVEKHPEVIDNIKEVSLQCSPIEQPKTRSQRIRGIIWDSLDKSPEERRFIFKVDCWILTYVCISYFIKYLDSSNVSNAYVSGMKEDLNITGTQYNMMSTYFYIGYILSQIASQVILSKVRPSIWLPTNEILYGAFAMGIAGAKNVETIYALRFLVGFFEGTAYVGIMTILSNFYLPDELGKRTCIFQTSSSAAQMFSGYLQSGLHSGMDGTGGMAAWRWLFIFDGIITMPIAVVGFFAIPDEPFSSKARWFSESDRQIGIGRLKKSNRNTRPKMKFSHFVSLLKDWPFYLFSIAFTVHVLGIRLYGFMNLWLKDTGDYSISKINTLPTAGFGLQIFATLTWAWLSDGFRSRWAIISIACLPAIIGSIILWTWPNDNKAAMFTGWYLLFMETGAGALFVSWISETMSSSVEHRYLMIGVIETVAFAFTAWVPIYLYPADDAPRYKYGYPITFMFFTLELVVTLIIALIQYYERKGVLKNKHMYQVYNDETEIEKVESEKLDS